MGDLFISFHFGANFFLFWLEIIKEIMILKVFQSFNMPFFDPIFIFLKSIRNIVFGSTFEKWFCVINLWAMEHWIISLWHQIKNVFSLKIYFWRCLIFGFGRHYFSIVNVLTKDLNFSFYCWLKNMIFLMIFLMILLFQLKHHLHVTICHF